MPRLDKWLHDKIRDKLAQDLPRAVVSGGSHGKPIRVDFKDGRIAELTRHGENYRLRVFRPAPELLALAQDEDLSIVVFPDDGRVTHTILRQEQETR